MLRQDHRLDIGHVPSRGGSQRAAQAFDQTGDLERGLARRALIEQTAMQTGEAGKPQAVEEAAGGQQDLQADQRHPRHSGGKDPQAIVQALVLESGERERSQRPRRRRLRTLDGHSAGAHREASLAPSVDAPRGSTVTTAR